MKKSESGRTILEMIAVIVTVGVLLMSSMAGYNFLVQRQQRNEAVKQVVTLVTALKTTEAAKSYGYQQLIPIKDVVSGEPRTADNGKVLRLSDGEESYVAVHAMKNGGFSLTLRAKQSTCDEILAALKGYSASVAMTKDGENTAEVRKVQNKLSQKSGADFVKAAGQALLEDTTVKYETDAEGNYVLNEEGQRKILSVDNGGTEGTQITKISLFDRISCESASGSGAGLPEMSEAFVLICEDGETLCDGRCQKCACGLEEDATGACCAADAMCGGLCNCPKGQIKVKQNGSCFCAECDGSKSRNIANADCVNRWTSTTGDSEKWDTHACDKDRYKCVECEEDADCWVTEEWSPYYKKYNQDADKYKHLYCDKATHRCTECTTSYIGTTIIRKGKCPESYPVCVAGDCRRCPKGYDPETQECIVATCTDECHKGDQKVWVVNPNIDEPYDNEGKIQDCGTTCVRCYDSNPDNIRDAGCTEKGEPICMSKDGRGNITSTGDNFPGDGCAYCVNTDEEKGTDLGCEDSAPFCVNGEDAAKWTELDKNAAGDWCVGCRNEQDCSEGYRCDETKHVCMKPCDGDTPYWNRDAKKGDQMCYVCHDDKSGAVTDSGCESNTEGRYLCQPKTKPATDNGTKGYGDDCRLCRNNNSDAKMDEGCWEQNPLCAKDQNTPVALNVYADSCFRCQDTYEQKTTTDQADLGCPGYEDGATKRICDTDNTASKKFSDKCVECLKNDHCPEVCHEKGCDTCENVYPDTPVWSPIEKTCVICMDTEDQSKDDAGCGSGKWAGKPLCVTDNNSRANWVNNKSSTTGTQCIFCYDDAKSTAVDSGCGTGANSDKPICVQGSNLDKWINNGTSHTTGDRCVQCVVDADCTGENHLGVCKEGACVICEDDQLNNGTDRGCNVGQYKNKDLHVCVYTPDDNPIDHTAWENTAERMTGTQCVRCFDEGIKTYVDPGCSDATPLCVGADFKNDGRKSEGTQCVFCYDSTTGSTADEGCNFNNSTTPFCVDATKASSMWVDNGKNTVGTKCVQCYNDTQCAEVCNVVTYACQTCAAYTDNARPIWRPVMKHADGHEEPGQCVFCYDTTGVDKNGHEVGDEDKIDDGCAGTTPVCVPKETTTSWYNDAGKTIGGQCIFCADTEKNAGMDVGCNLATPICVNDLVKKNPLKSIGDKTIGNKCVQCLVDSDCPVKEGQTVHCVSNYTCQYCWDNEKSPKTDNGCPDSAPLCVGVNDMWDDTNSYGARCVVCYDSATGTMADKGCDGADSKTPLCVPKETQVIWKNDGQKSEGAQCVFCYDSADGSSADEGCNGEKSEGPICVKGTSKTLWQNAHTKTVGDRCVQCLQHSDCAGKKNSAGGLVPFCDTESNTCISCYTATNGEKPVWNEEIGECAYCVDDIGGEAKDDGCPGQKDKDEKMCKPKANETGNGTKLSGEQCFRCRNNNYGANNGEKDEGCNDDNKLCEADESHYGMICHKCQDDAKAGEKDSGCDDEKAPICVVEGEFNKDAAPTSLYGESCTKCYDDEEENSVDTGCNEKTPICSDDRGSDKFATGGTKEKGTQCYECISNANCDPNGPTPVCNLERHVCEECKGEWDGEKCWRCKDDKSGDGQDTGCPLEEGNQSYMMCRSVDKPTENGTQLKGENCFLCRNNNSNAANDEGCKDSGKPLCDADTNAYGNTCYKCQDTVKQDSTHTTADLGCSGAAKLCGTTNAGDGRFYNECYECFKDEQCPSGRPVCNENTHTCVVCRDTQTQNNKDQGCDEGQWSGKPICYAGANDGQGKEGTYCIFCEDSAKGAEQDTGCGTGNNEGKNICVNGTDRTKWKNATTYTQGTQCVECIVNGDCADKQDSAGELTPICNPTSSTCVKCPADKPHWDGTQCVACLTSKDCPNNQFCTDDKECHYCNTEKETQAHTGVRCQDMGANELGCEIEQCECPAGYKKYFGTTLSTARGGNGGRWGCRAGCEQHSDVEDDECCFLNGNKTKPCTGESCLGFKGKAVKLEPGEHKTPYACPVKCESPCQKWDDEKGQCVSDCDVPGCCNGTCTGNCEVWNPKTKTCEYQCTEDEVCVPKLGNAKQSAKVCGGFVCKNPDCNEWISMRGAVDGNQFYIPPANKKYRVTHAAAQLFCEKCGWTLGTIQNMCSKDYHYDTGHDCPNISGNRIFSDQGYKLSAWHVEDMGSFWVNDEAKKNWFLRTTWSCGNNHPEHGCVTGFYPVCYAGGGGNGCPVNKPVQNPATKQCHVCLDNASGNGQDVGCNEGDWTGKPICDVSQKGGYGDACFFCKDDQTYQSNGTDTGCTADRPICVNGPKFSNLWRNEASGKIGTHCMECVTDNYCTRKYGSSKPVCNQSTYTCEACPSDKPYWNGKSCVECNGHMESGASYACKSSSKPFCDSDGMCKDCTTVSKARNHNPLRKLFGRNKNNELGCFVCKNDQADGKTDLGCTSSAPSCDTDSGKFGNTCTDCSGSDKCVDSSGKCISVNSYDDIKRGSDGKCECLAAVRTQSINDAGNSYSGTIDKDYNCYRLSTKRQRVYEIKVNFYCPRYMHVNDAAGADDFVAGSSPAGIGVNSNAVKSASWKYAHDNSITPRVSSATIKKGTALLVVQDRWAAEVGYSGFFYFTTTKGEGSAGSQKLTVTSRWASGHSKQSPTNGWLCKDGEGSSAKKRATGDAHCCR